MIDRGSKAHPNSELIQLAEAVWSSLSETSSLQEQGLDQLHTLLSSGSENLADSRRAEAIHLYRSAGMGFLRQQKYKRAKKALQQAIGLVQGSSVRTVRESMHKPGPDEVLAYRYLGILNHLEEKYDVAIWAYRKALSLDQDPHIRDFLEQALRESRIAE